METNTNADRIAAALDRLAPVQLANFVALREATDYPAGTCAAWMDSAERVCAKATTAADTYLCKRHTGVARARATQAVERQLARAAR